MFWCTEEELVKHPNLYFNACFGLGFGIELRFVFWRGI